jgi:steroid 5-alpha reductase family enzyme
VDVLVNTAASFPSPDLAGRIPDETWQATLTLNVTANYLLADEAASVFEAQGTPAALVLTSSANAVVPKRGSEAYDASKAAVSHLVRELAVRLAPTVRVNAIAPATVVSGSAMFPRDRVRSSLTKYGLAWSEEESTAQLRDRLAQFYAGRTLLRQPIAPEHCAEAILWLASLALRDSSIVDSFWGVGFVAIMLSVAAAVPGSLAPRAWLLGGLVAAWGLRLSHYIFWRNRGKGEDYRYRMWREEAGAAWWWRSFFKVFLLQGVVMWLVAAPVVAAVGATPQRPLNWIDGLAVAVWLLGFVFEAAGDWQLSRFKRDAANKGRLFTGGVWRYTRHPNYFGDAAVWWGHFLVAAASGAWWTVFSPALMTFLLVRVSGVAMLESAMRDSKPGYREYIETTSAFFPLPPRRR